ncbi:putative Fe(II)-dependent oxygenase superfamily protein [uncultured Mediterranean phage uvMED]|nr:putative Fe(II)-dependent oxygenase superfamily protein [uncultured Mediterranean phage uvMED]BAR20080.1 2OG-Fe(II) oxygenase [uncultured Mediterranean phage uvMED]BAR20127.1 2OG-Fe(II) oxygenase [uncultured Mediterranean phage uvMED]BAR20181.1 2OG-Fe(II) oxygenase [uncultured Mediterranean phage uvMED]BAR20211.1 2OG-Fe(II) oxygenase [uncultured Mediterranean phage uvMED]
MHLQNYYYYFQKALTPRFCDELIKYGISKQEQLARTGSYTKKKSLNKEDVKDLKKIRNSNITWLNERWIYKEIQPYIHEANRLAGWNFNWDFSESCQFTKYKLNQFYDWHCDSWPNPYDNEKDLNVHGKIRKLSVTCSLSDPKDYKGGELEFDYRNKNPNEKNNFKKCKEILPRGSIVVFPSFVWHRVKPVTKGNRYSLVIWNLGYPYQ